MNGYRGDSMYAVVICMIAAAVLVYIGVKKYEKCTAIQSFLSVIMIVFTTGVLIWLHRDNSFIRNIRLILVCSLLWPIAIHDYREKKIPNKYLVFGLCCWLITVGMELFFERKMVVTNLISGVIAAVGIFLVCMICLLIFRGSIGMGDVKLFMYMGLMQGVNGLFSAVFFSLIISFFVACFLLITKKKTKKDGISFGPAILIGTTISVILGGY